MVALSSRTNNQRKEESLEKSFPELMKFMKAINRMNLRNQDKSGSEST